MYRIALRMLYGDQIKFLTLVVGLSFAVLLIGQQGSIFCGLMLRTASSVFEAESPLWVMDPKVAAFNDGIEMNDSELLQMRSFPNVEWAVPFAMANVTAQADDGTTGIVQLMGVDDESMLGLPYKTLKSGRLEDLNSPSAIAITKDRSERYGSPKVGDYIELNDIRAKVVAIVDSNRTFTPFPTVFTTYSRLKEFVPQRQRYLTFILVKPKAGVSIESLKQAINTQTHLKAQTLWDFVWLTMRFWAANTGIPINFGITIFLGVIVGAAISGQTLYTFVLENVRYFAVFKAMGLSNGRLIRMVGLQSLAVGVIGYGMGLGLMSALGLALPANSSLAFYTPWHLVAFTGVVVVGFCVLASLLSLIRVLRVDPAMVFRG